MDSIHPDTLSRCNPLTTSVQNATERKQNNSRVQAGKQVRVYQPVTTVATQRTKTTNRHSHTRTVRIHITHAPRNTILTAFS